MNTKHRYRPRLDPLEDRTCPALTLIHAGGLLVVAGVPTSGTVFIQETGSNSFTVQDGSATPASFAHVTSLSVSLGRGNDTVDINLGGNTFAGAISSRFAGGTNALSIENGTAGLLNIGGGSGSNAITLGDGSMLKVTGATVVNLAGNASDTFTLANNVNLVGNLSVANASTVNLASGSAIGHSAAFFAARTGTVVDDAATIGTDVMFFGNFAIAAGQDTLQVNGTVGRNITFSSSFLNTVGDEVDVNANVGGNVYFAGGGLFDTVNVASGVTIGGNFTTILARGSDTVNVSDGSTVKGGALLNLGNGQRLVNFGATVGNNTNALVLAVFGGVGNEMVTFTAGASIRGQALASLSRFSLNTVSFSSAQTFNTYTFSIDGGFGGFNTLNLNGTHGTTLTFRDFATVNP
jgi:hypothetical protein